MKEGLSDRDSNVVSVLVELLVRPYDLRGGSLKVGSQEGCAGSGRVVQKLQKPKPLQAVPIYAQLLPCIRCLLTLIRALSQLAVSAKGSSRSL